MIATKMIDHVVILKPSIGKALAMIAEQRIETPTVLTKAEKTFKIKNTQR